MEKTHSLRFRVTEEESKQLEEAAIRLLGRPNKSRFIRKLIRDYIGMGLDLTDEELKEFRKAVVQLTGISRNLNQITTRINSDENKLEHLSVDYLERIKNHVNEVNNQLKNHISRTITRFQDVVNHDNK